MKQVADKHSGPKSLRVRSLVTEVKDDKPTGTQFKQVFVYDFKSRKLRSRVLDAASGKELYATERDLSRKPVALGSALLLETLPANLAQALRAAGIVVPTDDEIQASDPRSLARWKEEVAWVLGKPEKTAKKSDDVSGNELWVKKDAFVPIRLLSAEGDIRFENYRSAKEFPFPRSISLAEGNKIVLREEVSDVAVDVDAAELTKPIKAGFTPEGDSADSSVQDLIQLYYRTIR